MSEIRGSAGNDVRLTVNSTVCNLYGAMDNEKNNRRSAFDACSEQNTAEKTRHRGVVAPQEHAENDDEKPLLLARSVRHDGSTTADNDAPKTDAEAVERIGNMRYGGATIESKSGGCYNFHIVTEVSAPTDVIKRSKYLITIIPIRSDVIK